MTRFKSLLAAAVTTAIAAVVPVAHAQVVHVVGAGSSAQFLGTMVAMSQLANNNLAGGQCIYHWTKKSAISAHDNRDSLNRIIDETGNVGIVWDAACSDTTGNTNISDVWLDGQFDSTLGVRLFSAQQKSGAGSGATVYLTGVSAGTISDNLVNPNGLWADNKSDVNLPGNLLSVFGTSSPGTYNVNLGLTDIRPEDALAATKRAYSALDTVAYKGLGYVGPTAQIGAPIYTAASGSTSNFTPIGFGLSGAKDPINTAATVPSYTTYPVGAAPIVFIYNNGGTYKTSLSDLSTGIVGDGTKGTSGFKLAHLFDGSTSCDTNNPAFTGGGDGTATPLTLYLREPLSGTMNTTEFTTFRTTGNTSDSQEVGIINPTRSPYNPLNLNCTGNGHRERRIGNGQVLSAVNANVNSMGYMFFSFGNATSLIGSNPQANYQYFTLDGVDPLGISGTVNQQLPYCKNSLCQASTYWSGGISFPNLRNGTYKAWSLYRWLIYDSNTDSLGPKALVTSIQDNIDSTVADFVPFTTSTNSDGLEVYRSHFTQSAKTCGYTAVPPGNQCNGSASPTESLTNGNSLGGGVEQGGDEGGVIVGWDHSTVTTANVTTGACTGLSKVSKTAGRKFGFSATDATHTGGNPAALVGLTVTINSNSATVSGCIAPTSTTLYVSPALTTGTGQSFGVYIAPTPNGMLGKKQ